MKKRKTFNVDASTLSQLSERAKQLRISENALARLFFERGLSSSDDTLKRELIDLTRKIERESVESQIKVYEAVQVMKRANDESLARIESRLSERTESLIDAISEIMLAAGNPPTARKQQAPVTGRGLADQ